MCHPVDPFSRFLSPLLSLSFFLSPSLFLSVAPHVPACSVSALVAGRQLRIFAVLPQDGRTAAYCAAYQGHVEVLRVLVVEGQADANLPNQVTLCTAHESQVCASVVGRR